MIQDSYQIRPRYSEVDQMGYVYHANYVTYCHQARTELLRKLELNDALLEENDVMLPVIDFQIQYKKPAHYDEVLTISTYIKELPQVRFHFDFEIHNQDGDLIAEANSTVVFAHKSTRQPFLVPPFVEAGLSRAFHSNLIKR